MAVKLVRLLSRIFLSFFFKIHVTGARNIPDTGSFVLLPKHQCWEDIPVIGISVKRPLYYVAKQELFKNLFSKWFISMLGGLPLNRRSPTRSRTTFLRMLQVLSEGEGVVVFPEGTYYKNCMGPGRTGLIRLIYANINTLFIPAGIQYGPGRLRKNVQVSIGEPIKGDDCGSVHELMSSVMAEISRLSGL